ncbi:uroporphyrinogen-III synthase HemD family protein [Asticcacaulis biprosthecium C19]|uniref:Uroporphyrinogen-III synthase HemD family protein n=1 Tax=Asticcacaulis biprosthecium C19 TaxID=715226 RepID=F4QI48_9CAUL|nr:uroporphyrinogen-III synthase [Asticcacaulis biprosthecium]EGF92915.1 uroporphyrinogen-III synthase HemD family protein [Asticcacaulis biprosthecium C19]
MTQPVVWITRTPDGARSTAKAIQALGGDAILAPVLKVVPLKPIIDPHSFDAVILTSRNGLAAFGAIVARRSITAWCVGEATAEAARAARYQTVISADGDVDALTKLIIETADQHTRLLYAAPREPAGDLAGDLAKAGFLVREAAVYETRPVMPVLHPADMARLTYVLVHSAKAGRAVAAMLKAHRDRFVLDQLTFVCISDSAWHGLEQALNEGEKNIDAARLIRRISPFPDEASMLKQID